MSLKKTFLIALLAASQAVVSRAQTITVHGQALDPTQHSLALAAHSRTLPQVHLQASPTSITSGQSTTVTWTTTNATSAKLNGTSVATNGSMVLSPTANAAVTLAATGSGGTASSTVNITVQSPGTTSSNAPHINFTDLNVGSGTGGDQGHGVYVRIFGSGFGSSQGSSQLKLGGAMVTNCTHCSWSDTQIIAQVGSAASTGNITVTVNGVTSNGAPFTVTPTNIVFVATNGSDSNSGTFAAPFATWRAAFNAVTQGDNGSPSQNTVIYLEPGTCVCSDDGRGYRATVSTDLGGSSPTKQIALVGYPGGTASVGSLQVDNGIHGWGKYMTFADLTIIGRISAIDAEGGNVRIVNNDISCPSVPSGTGDTACILGETDTPSDTWTFQHNYVHNTGGNVQKTYHAVYFSTNANHLDVGWNSIGVGFKGYCRSLMFHASSGSNLYDIHAHDNFITGGYCDGINFASVNPAQGTVEAYNNVIVHTAVASNPYGVANEAGIAVNSDPAGSTSGSVLAYNNTIVDAGGYTNGNQNGCFGVVMSGATLVLTNNICSQPAQNQPYIESQSAGVSGSHNLWYGAGASPSWDSGSVNANPAFVSATNFALTSSSPAAHKGSSSKMSTVDYIGVHRASPPSIGAYE